MKPRRFVALEKVEIAVRLTPAQVRDHLLLLAESALWNSANSEQRRGRNTTAARSGSDRAHMQARGAGHRSCRPRELEKRMTDWWKESGHIAEKHENCERSYCNICEGGLAICTRCGLTEGSLTTHCPGTQSYGAHGEQVYTGKEDFFDGRWVEGRRTVFMYPQDYLSDAAEVNS
jgi:hypothetical protein